MGHKKRGVGALLASGALCVGWGAGPGLAQDAPPVGDAPPAAGQAAAPATGPGTLHFRVVDADTEKPLAGVTITIHDPANAKPDVRLTTDAQGDADSPPLDAQLWQITTTGAGGHTDTRLLSVAAGVVTNVGVSLEPLTEKVIKITAERSNNLVGIAPSAGEGTVGARQIRERPLLRPGEILEAVPGVVVTQHSGSGKANQYYLRGFNLDHGTDLASFVDGMPVNMRTHAHGQGYSDINFLIPELVSGITYRKGSYRADQGDFSAAGSIYASLFNRLQPSLAEVTLGTFGYQRLLLAGTPPGGGGNLTYGLELFHNDGPWVVGDDYRKINGVVRYGQGDDKNGYHLTAMGYDGRWNSTDQIPKRAVTNGTLDRFGEVDPTDGGKSYRYSLSGTVQKSGDKTETRANAYVISSKLNLFSNFTYFLDHPETNPVGQQGDQFEQAEKRTVAGFEASQTWKASVGRAPMENTAGVQFRYDNISPIGLYQTQNRVRFATTRQDRVRETSIAPYVENRVRWTPTFRTLAGLRFDSYGFRVEDSSIPQNAGHAQSSIVSPKLSFIFGPYRKTDYYLNFAQGFHSNDARGTTITVDPATLALVPRVTPLVKANEAEIGVRTAAVKNLQTTAELWYLKLDSELLFTGDAGTTEPSRPSERTGFEITNFYTPTRNVTINADYAISRARFTDSDPIGSRIPGAIEGVADLGVAYEPPVGAFGAVRLRYFGPRPLIEDNSVRSQSSTLVNTRLGYLFRNNVRLSFEVFNIFNAAVSDVDYYYTSRLPGEAADGVDDVHFHPAESRSVRLGVTYQY